MKAKPTIRCAVYTRKSTDEGLDQAFNSLDAQREACESYIASQKGEGWVCLDTPYDDGGYTGGNSDRPALQHLLKDIEDRGINCVVVYKVDRLSRSLLDFARMMSVFEKHGVSFVSVTQSFDTSQSMGRLMLNVLLSFAQFERELVSERTRDKIAASRRKGMWTGGRPVLGYDLDFKGGRLTVNPAEAERVRAIFALYLAKSSLLETARELRARKWTTKAWTTKARKAVGGTAFDKGNLYQLLSNILYTGRVRYGEEHHPGQHEAIVDARTWDRVQAMLRSNGRDGGSQRSNKQSGLLKGLLHCGVCRCAMTHTFSIRAGKRVYRYYACAARQKKGRDACSARLLPAGEIERLIVERVARVGVDPDVLSRVLDNVRQSKPGEPKERVDAALVEFGAVWAELAPREQVRALRLLVRRVTFDAAKGTVAITFLDGVPRTLLASGEEAA